MTLAFIVFISLVAITALSVASLQHLRLLTLLKEKAELAELVEEEEDHQADWLRFADETEALIQKERTVIEDLRVQLDQERARKVPHKPMEPRTWAQAQKMGYDLMAKQDEGLER